MVQWHLVWPWQTEEIQVATTVDLGGGRVVNAEDIVDGHAQRLHKEAKQETDKSTSTSVTNAMRVVAPELAPLTDLAQNIANQSTKAQPDGKFRSDLQRALESSYRQQHVRRKLGLQPAAQKDLPWFQSPWLIGTVVVVMLMVFRLLYQQSRRSISS
ncbi:MAG: hypothetical protein U0175_05715 [Caldilineaceae bacterium]